MKFKKLIAYSKWLWIAIVITAVGYYLVTKWESIGDYLQLLSIPKILFSILLIILAKLNLVAISKYSIEKEGCFLPYKEVFSIVSFTHLAKYIPGGIWHFVGRFSAYNQREMEVRSSTRALVHENLWLISGAFFTGAFFGMLSSQGRGMLESFGIGVPVYFLLAALLGIWILFLLGYENLIAKTGFSKVYLIFITSLLAWILLGISFGLILPGFSSGMSFFYIGVYAFGWIAGYVAIFAPGGIGIRETVLVWLVGGLLDPELAIIYSSVHRFLFIVAEIILGGVSLAIGFVNGKDHQGQQDAASLPPEEG